MRSRYWRLNFRSQVRCFSDMAIEISVLYLLVNYILLMKEIEELQHLLRTVYVLRKSSLVTNISTNRNKVILFYIQKAFIARQLSRLQVTYRLHT